MERFPYTKFDRAIESLLSLLLLFLRSRRVEVVPRPVAEELRHLPSEDDRQEDEVEPHLHHLVAPRVRDRRPSGRRHIGEPHHQVGKDQGGHNLHYPPLPTRENDVHEDSMSAKRSLEGSSKGAKIRTL